MQKARLQKHWDGGSVVLIEDATNYQRFLKGESLALEECITDYDPGLCFEGLTEGPCLVALEELISLPTQLLTFLVPVPTWDPRVYILTVAANFWLAEFRSGRVTRCSDRPLQDILETYRASRHDSIRTIPMRQLEEFMCSNFNSKVITKKSMFPDQTAYNALYETGSFAGIMNRSYGFGDLVWIERDMCSLWIRLDPGLNFEWVKLFRFRVDRSDDPGET